MILAVSIVVSLAVALLRGGRFSSLLRLPLRWGLLAVAAFAVQAFFIYQSSGRKEIGIWRWQEVLFVGSHALLLLTVWANRHLAGVTWIGLGLLFNLVVMVANGGWMPITAEALTQVGHTSLVDSLDPGTRVASSKSIILPRQETRLWILSDVLILARPFPVPSAFSIGDVLIATGVFFLLQGAMLSYRE
ncbi:MAG: hypothetical protein FJ026_09630 [Chloroflexi bacterium]|nr:hypothetical protein [Chloroflexota bacterium]